MAMLTEKLKKIYTDSQADALLVEQDFLRRYLTGFYSTDGYVILDGSRCIFVADSRYFEAAEKALSGSGIEVKEGGLKTAEELLKPYHRLGVPYPFESLARAEALRSEGYELVDCMPALKSAMIRKTERELALIGEACDIAETALLKLMPQLKEGMREREAAALLEYEMRALGAEGTSFETIVAFGSGGSVPHHETGETKLKFGDPVLIDFGCKKEGYCSDCTRTFLFGDDQKHEEFKKVYREVLGAHLAVLDRVCAGMTGKQADAVARDYLKEKGLAEYFTHSLGHGIGLQIHEYPTLSPHGEEVLSDGMVFSDEPGVYLAGQFGVRIEDSVCMDHGRIRSFMKKTDKNLIIL